MQGWNNLFDTLNTVALVIGLLAVGFGISLWQASRKDRKRVRHKNASARPSVIPTEWPLAPRPIVTAEERHVWHWLHDTFPECLVLPKLPVTRFTAPLSHIDAQHWFSVLGNVYCSFTLCNPKGVVIGCVDVTGPRNFSRSSRQLKQSLLSQCDMAYWVVTPEALPATEVIRAEFLGDETAQAYYDIARRPAAPVERPAPLSGFRPMSSTAPATAPVPLFASDENFEETRDQLRETLVERRRTRRYQRSAANDNLSHLRTAKAAAPALAVVASANSRPEEEDALPEDSFFMDLDDEKNRDTMLSLLSAAR